MRNYEIIRSYNDGKGNLYRFTEQNKNGETIEFSIDRCGDCDKPTNKNSLPYFMEEIRIYKPSFAELLARFHLCDG